MKDRQEVGEGEGHGKGARRVKDIIGHGKGARNVKDRKGAGKVGKKGIREREGQNGSREGWEKRV